MDRNIINDLREFKDLTITYISENNNCMQFMYDLGNNNICFEVNFSQDRIDFFKELTKNIIEALRKKIDQQNKTIKYLKDRPTNISFVCSESIAQTHKVETGGNKWK